MQKKKAMYCAAIVADGRRRSHHDRCCWQKWGGRGGTAPDPTAKVNGRGAKGGRGIVPTLGLVGSKARAPRQRERLTGEALIRCLDAMVAAM